MALVAVIYLRGHAELAEGADTADSEKEFLLQTVLPVSTIEVVCDRPVLRKVLRDVCIKKIELRAAYIHSPETCIEVAARESHADAHPVAVLVTYRRCRDLHEILSHILCHLLALSCELLVEISETIEKTYCHEIGVHVRSLLDIVTGKDTQTA